MSVVKASLLWERPSDRTTWHTPPDNISIIQKLLAIHVSIATQTFLHLLVQSNCLVAGRWGLRLQDRAGKMQHVLSELQLLLKFSKHVETILWYATGCSFSNSNSNSFPHFSLTLILSSSTIFQPEVLPIF